MLHKIDNILFHNKIKSFIKFHLFFTMLISLIGCTDNLNPQNTTTMENQNSQQNLQAASCSGWNFFDKRAQEECISYLTKLCQQGTPPDACERLGDKLYQQDMGQIIMESTTNAANKK